jgi:hypothetical protein
MSKKLIAVASAAALALSALVAAPASAAVFSVTVSGGTGTGVSSTTATTINVPSANTVGWSTAGNTTATALRFTVATTGATSAVSVTATGGVKLLTTTQYDATGDDAATSATGATSLSGAALSESFTFYATTTSTATGTIVVTEGGNSSTRYVKGIAGPAYKISVTAPTAISASVKSEILVKATDAFGNAVTNLAAGNFTVTHLGGSEVNTTDSATGTAYRVASGDQALYIQGSATAGPAAITVVATGNSTQVAAANITAFGSRSLSKFISITNADLSGQVTALTAQVAALTADFNALAKKYNKLVRKSKRVATK